MTIKEQICEIMNEVKPTANLEGVANIIDGGYIESLELMMLISQLEEKFGVEIGFEEIEPENFNSLDAVARMVERLLG